MKFIAATFALFSTGLLTGCANTAIGLQTSAPPSMRASAPGSSYGSAVIQFDAKPNAYFSALFLGAYVAGVQDNYMSAHYAADGRKPPPLAEDRAIEERDCSQPLAVPSANLRCK